MPHMFNTLIIWCRPVSDRLAANYRGYWRRYQWLLIATSITAFADLITTIRFMRADGIEQELHPAIRIVASLVGPLLGAFIGKLAQLAAIVLVTLYARRIAIYVFIAATMLHGWAAWYNVWGRDIYTPLLIEWLPL